MKTACIALMCAAIPVASMAQSAIDAGQLSQSDFRGTARFMSMGGAFTALGGDLSSLIQNPAGIGVYRSSEVGVTLDINPQSTSTSPISNLYPYKTTQTPVACNNFGYVGATTLDGAMKSFNWGVTFNRTASFERRYRGSMATLNTSLSNYIADFTSGNGILQNEMLFTDTYNPYLQSDIPWLSTLAYSTYMITPEANSDGQYFGMFDQHSEGNAIYEVKEKGHVDEYNISFGGNVENVVYWGLGIGITDLDYRRYVYYSEEILNAAIQPANSEVINADYTFDLYNNKHIYGSGWNIKAGVIIKPVNEFRIGLSVHTPTWYSLSEKYFADNDYSFTPCDFDGNPTGEKQSGNDYTDEAFFKWKFNSPWKLMVGMAGVIGNRAILSLDYEYRGYNSMSIKNPGFVDDWGNSQDYQANEYANSNIKDYYKSSNTVRLGLEYRVTPQFSLRAGYNVTTSNVKDDAKDGRIEISTYGTDPSYSFDKTTQNICFGLGYKYQQWYIDAAYVHTNRKSDFHAFTNWAGNVAPANSVTDNNSSIVLSTGFRF